MLTRGHTLRPHVLLLGGPNYVHPRHAGSVAGQHPAECGRSAKSRSRKAPLLTSSSRCRENAQYFAALGAIEFGNDEDEDVGRYQGSANLEHYIDFGRAEEKAAAGGKGLVSCPFGARHLQGRLSA